MSNPARHEADTTAVRPVLAILVATLILIPLLSLLMWGVMPWLQPEPQPASGVQPGPVSAPGPRLQRAPQADLAEWRRQQAERLNSTGWIDRETGTLHIPIDRAMDLLVERGLPEQDQPTEEGGSQ